MTVLGMCLPPWPFLLSSARTPSPATWVTILAPLTLVLLLQLPGLEWTPEQHSLSTRLPVACGVACKEKYPSLGYELIHIKQTRHLVVRAETQKILKR